MLYLEKALENAFLMRYPEDASLVIEQSSLEEFVRLLEEYPVKILQPSLHLVTTEFLIGVLPELNEEIFKKLLQLLSAEQISHLLTSVEEEMKEKIRTRVTNNLKHEVEEILKYPPETAGSIMEQDIICFDQGLTVEEAIAKIKKRKKRGIRILFITDAQGQLVSMVYLQELVLAGKNTLLKDIAVGVSTAVLDTTPQEDILEEFEIHKLSEIPVVDMQNHLVGVVRHHSLVQAAKEEYSKDIQKMVGVSEDERAFSRVKFAVQKRLPWLEINLLTAFLAAAVVGLFESTIAQFTALAVLLPVVAGQSGNTGAQALAVTMRGLALKEVRTSQWFRLIFKELRIAFVTGFVVAVTTFLGVLLWSKSWGLSSIIFISMMASMIVASISGALVPVLLTRVGQDPASASSIILTTITDVSGFFSFLGIATLLSRFI
ncbi:MAG TPA: magnesium transporter [Gammaproteobacteria bacterium]|nr:magnesium transporter [Gammaproteobacteria bacterium]